LTNKDIKLCNNIQCSNLVVAITEWRIVTTEKYPHFDEIRDIDVSNVLNKILFLKQNKQEVIANI